MIGSRETDEYARLHGEAACAINPRHAHHEYHPDVPFCIYCGRKRPDNMCPKCFATMTKRLSDEKFTCYPCKRVASAR